MISRECLSRPSRSRPPQSRNPSRNPARPTSTEAEAHPHPTALDAAEHATVEAIRLPEEGACGRERPQDPVSDSPEATATDRQSTAGGRACRHFPTVCEGARGRPRDASRTPRPRDSPEFSPLHNSSAAAPRELTVRTSPRDRPPPFPRDVSSHIYPDRENLGAARRFAPPRLSASASAPGVLERTPDPLRRFISSLFQARTLLA